MKETVNQMWPDIQKRINTINEEAEKEGRLLPEPNDSMQVILFRNKPKYPKKNIFQRIKTFLFFHLGRGL